MFFVDDADDMERAGIIKIGTQQLAEHCMQHLQYMLHRVSYHPHPACSVEVLRYPVLSLGLTRVG